MSTYSRTETVAAGVSTVILDAVPPAANFLSVVQQDDATALWFRVDGVAAAAGGDDNHTTGQAPEVSRAPLKHHATRQWIRDNGGDLHVSVDYPAGGSVTFEVS